MLGRILSSQRGHDAKLLTRLLASTKALSPSIRVVSPSLGSSNSALREEHTPMGTNLFPDLSWTLAPETNPNDVKSYILIVEDPDAPLPSPVVHGLYYAIPATKRAVSPADFQVAEGNGAAATATAAARNKKTAGAKLKGGFWRNR